MARHDEARAGRCVVHVVERREAGHVDGPHRIGFAEWRAAIPGRTINRARERIVGGGPRVAAAQLQLGEPLPLQLRDRGREKLREQPAFGLCRKQSQTPQQLAAARSVLKPRQRFLHAPQETTGTFRDVLRRFRLAPWR